MHECDAPLQIDGSFTPSEVRIEGGRDVELQVVAGAPLLLRLLPGAPPVRLVGLQLEGLVIANGSRLEASDSTFRGGITVVGAADVLLRDRTLLLSGEVAPAVRLRDGARLRYRLPALKGRWIFAPGGDEQELTEDVDGDFPFACAPGVSGSSDDMEKQNGPQCSGLCPAGFMCPGATGEPRPCSAGGYCSGGDPLAFPDLTWEQFSGFHSSYYHPSNAHVFFFGNDDAAKRLDIVDEYFRDYETKDTSDSQVGWAVPAWAARVANHR